MRGIIFYFALLSFLVCVEPTDAAPAKDDRGFHFNWDHSVDAPMDVERTTSIGGGVWSKIALSVANGRFSDTNPPSSAAFYRAVSQEPSSITNYFGYTGSMVAYRVPDGVYNLDLVAVGASGSGHGGSGAHVAGAISVLPGDLLYITVGGSAGFNGGGTARYAQYLGNPGGGASDIRFGGTNLEHRVLVAGGGGGGGDRGAAGGASGLNGHDGAQGFQAFYQWGTLFSATGGKGGTQANGGAAGGNNYSSAGALGNGGWNGGGGYYGGGGGGFPQSGSAPGGGGGGGSSFADAAMIKNANFATAPVKGNGHISIVSSKRRMVIVQGGTLPPLSSLAGQGVDAFAVCETEVTYGEWRAVRSWAAKNGYDLDGIGVGSTDDHPVRNVNWYDVLKWCNAKSEMENVAPAYLVGGAVYRSGQLMPEVLPGSIGYRLPTELEWEWAARGGRYANGFTYSGSNDLAAVGWFYDNSSSAVVDQWAGRGTWPVGQKAANELGLFDMSGNVFEWCFDPFAPDHRKICGGAWLQSADKCTVNYRGMGNPAVRGSAGTGVIGFRLFRSLGH